MKAKHRREIFLARMSFVIFLVMILAIVIGLVCWGVSKRRLQESTQNTETETEKEFIMDFNKDLDTEIFDETQTPEDIYGEDGQVEVYYKTTQRVNLRVEANTDCNVLTTLDAGAQVMLLEEAGDWIKVSYGEQTGYIKLEYVTRVE